MSAPEPKFKFYPSFEPLLSCPSMAGARSLERVRERLPFYFAYAYGGADGLAGKGRAELAKGSPVLRGMRTHQPIFEDRELGKARLSEHPCDEGGALWPAVGVDPVAGKDGVAKEAGNRDVGYRQSAAEESVRRNLRLEIVEELRNLACQRSLHDFLVRGLAEYEGPDRDLVEQVPDKPIPIWVSANSSSQRARARRTRSCG